MKLFSTKIFGCFLAVMSIFNCGKRSLNNFQNNNDTLNIDSLCELFISTADTQYAIQAINEYNSQRVKPLESWNRIVMCQLWLGHRSVAMRQIDSAIIDKPHDIGLRVFRIQCMDSILFRDNKSTILHEIDSMYKIKLDSINGRSSDYSTKELVFVYDYITFVSMYENIDSARTYYNKHIEQFDSKTRYSIDQFFKAIRLGTSGQ